MFFKRFSVIFVFALVSAVFGCGVAAALGGTGKFQSYYVIPGLLLGFQVCKSRGWFPEKKKKEA